MFEVTSWCRTTEYFSLLKCLINIARGQCGNFFLTFCQAMLFLLSYAIYETIRLKMTRKSIMCHPKNMFSTHLPAPCLFPLSYPHKRLPPPSGMPACLNYTRKPSIHITLTQTKRVTNQSLDHRDTWKGSMDTEKSFQI